MTFDDLLTETFELATGKSRASARRARRFKQLCAEAPRVPYTSNVEVAEMLLLGEMIADRAFANLPLKLRKVAKTWPHTDHQGQVDILNMLYRVLGEESDDVREKLTKKGFTVNGSLPPKYGKWKQGDLGPNCLGMSQMLIGFARATGAPYMMIDTLRRHDIYVSEYRYLRYRELLAIIEPYRNNRWINAVSKIATRDMNDTLDIIAKHTAIPESHALLAIRTGEEWWIIDPYMKICCKDDYDQKRLDELYGSVITKRPSMTAAVKCNEGKMEKIAEASLLILGEYIPYLDKLDQPRSMWTFNREGVQMLTYSLMGYMPANDKETMVKVGEKDIELRMSSVYPKHVYERILTDKSNPFAITDSFMADLDRRVVDLDRTKRSRNRAFRRLTKTVIANTFNHISDVDIAIDAPPTHREYMHATMQLAIKTIDQLATSRHIDTPQLIKFGSNQWLLYNMLGSVERSGSKRFQQILTRKARRFKGYEHLVLPQLQPHLPQLIGEKHGK